MRAWAWLCVNAWARGRVQVRAYSLTYPAFVAPLAAPYFSTLPHKRQDFQKKVIEYKICILIFSTTSN